MAGNKEGDGEWMNGGGVNVVGGGGVTALLGKGG